MNIMPKIFKRFVEPRSTQENLAFSLSEKDLWNLFNMYISDDDFQAALQESGGSLGGNVASRLKGYHRLLSYDVTSSQLGMEQIKRLIDVCWQMYDYDPLIKQGIDSRALYTFGQGVTIGCRKKGSWSNQVTKEINDFWFDPCNFKQFTSTSALISLDVQAQIEGNVPLFFWREDGGMWQARSLKTSWLEHLVMSSNSLPSSKVIGYVLNLGSTSNGNSTAFSYVNDFPKVQRVAYADIDADPSELESLVGDIPIDYNGRIAMLKSWGRPWSGLGTSPIIPALGPAQRYGGFLEDWAIVQGLFRTFAMSVVSKGTNKGVQDIIRKYKDTSVSSLYNPALSSSDIDRNGGDTPVAHTLFSGMTSTGQAGTRLEAIKTAGATEGPERARELKLMLCSAFGLPETMFGDAKVGNHATAHTLERTVDLRAQANQTLWGDFIESILRFIARESRWGELQSSESVTIFVRFPPIVEHVLNDHVEAIASSYREGLITDFVATREILQALHVTDTEEILNAMYPDNSDFGKTREPVDIVKTDTDVEKAKIQAEAIKDNAKMMMARSTVTKSSGSNGNGGSSSSSSNGGNK